GPLGTLTVTQVSGEAVTFPAGGRGIDFNGDGIIDANEGLVAAAPIRNRDGLRQTAVDLMQLVRAVEIGMAVGGEPVPDLDASRIYYIGFSLGGFYGTPFLAVEPDVHAGVLNVAGGPGTDVNRLSPANRPSVGANLAARVPSLINIGGLEFNENLPLRDQQPVINDVPGAMAIQEVFDWGVWVRQASNPVAYGPYLRRQPLEGVPAQSVILQLAKGDQQVPNPTEAALLRSGGLADRATYYRHDLAFADLARNPTGVPKDPHSFIFFSPGFFPAVADIGAGAQHQIAVFLAS